MGRRVTRGASCVGAFAVILTLLDVHIILFYTQPLTLYAHFRLSSHLRVAKY